ncbi:hypothetical protein KGG93_gp72 [Streptomyces phage Endor2]|uniref:Uncharacterized protein n=1 Tax=Streptomyces phage Endor2 TaxID=2740182 RepID=A0A7G4AX74_9CAUD|nr:hypothetical protein KGG93_gp72 [Streptomyces phage Endor2]QMP84614.1 hypothetical protein HUN44_00070 [Streptomyces phage Endor2]
MKREQAEQVLAKIEELYPLDKGYFFLADHNHEGLSEGAWSLALEGAGEWVFEVSEKAGREPEWLPGVFLEPVTSWCLGIYPA